jgi:serine---pyruvate transaminase
MLKRYLLAPGPTPVPPEALLAMAMPIIHHRSPDFLPVLEAAKKGLQWLYQTKDAWSAPSTIFSARLIRPLL